MADTGKTLANGIAGGDRRALARAVTLIESGRADHRAEAMDLFAALPQGREALRIGLSGTPGVGKSTFIESFGLMLAEKGLRLAVLAVDPTSALSGGSILGDKTRMERLVRAPGVFIRPSPAGAQLGGVARRTREVIALTEAAGFDVILVETVGVGQSETMVAEMTDVFALLLAPAGGDELQGVKRGIMERADMILVNKADGDLMATAQRTVADYSGALRLLRSRAEDPEGFPKAMAVSALEERGLSEAWGEIAALAEWRKDSGVWAKRREGQRMTWLKEEVQAGLEALLSADPDARAALAAAEAAVVQGEAAPTVAAEGVIAHLRGRNA